MDSGFFVLKRDVNLKIANLIDMRFEMFKGSEILYWKEKKRQKSLIIKGTNSHHLKKKSNYKKY